MKYLTKLVSVLLDANFLFIHEFEKCLSEKANVDCIKKFTLDPKTQSLAVKAKMNFVCQAFQKCLHSILFHFEIADQSTNECIPIQYLITT
jgi:hypothetical protein